MWAEPCVVEAARKEYDGVVEEFLATGEKLFGPYVWGRCGSYWLACPWLLGPRSVSWSKAPPSRRGGGRMSQTGFPGAEEGTRGPLPGDRHGPGGCWVRRLGPLPTPLLAAGSCPHPGALQPSDCRLLRGTPASPGELSAAWKQNRGQVLQSRPGEGSRRGSRGGGAWRGLSTGPGSFAAHPVSPSPGREGGGSAREQGLMTSRFPQVRCALHAPVLPIRRHGEPLSDLRHPLPAGGGPLLGRRHHPRDLAQLVWEPGHEYQLE